MLEAYRSDIEELRLQYGVVCAALREAERCTQDSEDAPERMRELVDALRDLAAWSDTMSRDLMRHAVRIEILRGVGALVEGMK